MTKRFEKTGVLVPEILLPKNGTDYSKWAVVACDQYTSQPEYWADAEKLIGTAPSTLNIILPEAFLGGADEAEKIASIRENMEKYLADGTLTSVGQGFVLVSRKVGGKTRSGLVLALDLEQYDYHKGSSSLIRATEATVESRIPPRLKIREGAAVELPHILVLIDDPGKTVIEPLIERAAAFPLLYDTELMLNGGHITGRLINRSADIDSVATALDALMDADAFHKKYGDGYAPLLFAMGDGNHSLATAKAYWEKTKATIPEAEWAEHPARYALVEIENVHDSGIVFEPIHRVVFGVEPERFLNKLSETLKEQNGSAEVVNQRPDSQNAKAHIIPVISADKERYIVVDEPAAQLAVGTLQNAIDRVLSENPGEVDYIHGENVVRKLAAGQDSIGFLLPVMKKEELFPTVVYDGALPRKTFSMGEANEKRYYMECKKITR